MPALLPFHPSVAANIIRYRYNSLEETYKIAQIFGYKGSMFAWTACVFSLIVIIKIINRIFLDLILVERK
jgi:hypothetical protein